MTTEAPRHEELYMALELGGSNWKVMSTLSLGRKPRSVSITAGALVDLDAEISKAKRRFDLPDSARVLSCYEAGRDGFHIHRHLVDQGVLNVVIDPASVAVDRRSRQAKSDRLDGEKMLKHLIRSQDDPKEWRTVRIPSIEEEDQRHLNRELSTLKKERTSHTSRIKSLLVLHNIRVSVNRKFLQILEGLVLPSGLRARLEREYERWTLVSNQIRDLEKMRRQRIKDAETRAERQAQQLCQLQGIGETTAWTVAHEMLGWREFTNRRQVGAILGLTPTPFVSDNIRREQGISKAGLKRVRALAVEVAWLWLRYQPQSDLSLWFKRRFGDGARSRKVGIVALARKLMIGLWRYVDQDILPRGATLKA